MSVTVGQEYYPATWKGPRSQIMKWRVVELFRAPDGIIHARLVLAANQAERRTVSCDALADRRLFSPIQ
jgi:hypothetical protein